MKAFYKGALLAALCLVCTLLLPLTVSASTSTTENATRPPLCDGREDVILTLTPPSVAYNETVECIEHVPGEWITDVDATCTTNGKKHIECTVCGAIIRDGSIPALGHNLTDYIYDNNATCTEGGTKTSYCLNGCGRSKTVADEDHPALGHVSSEPVIEDYIEAGCEDGSYIEKIICLSCDVVLSRTRVILHGTGHTESDYRVVYSSPTCTEYGIRYVECTVCHTPLYMEKDAPLGHTESDWIIDTPPHCETVGSRHKICLVCNKITVESTMDPLGHSFTNYVNSGNATCTSGTTMSAKCDNGCGTINTYYVGPQLGHTGGKATCCALAVCERCEIEYGDYAPHDYEEWEVVKEPTCTTMGEKRRACSVCDDTQIAYTAKIHVPGEWRVRNFPTCISYGVEETNCQLCYCTITRRTSKAMHEEGEWIVDKAATCHEYGSMHTECKYCRKFMRNINTPHLTHSYTIFARNITPINTHYKACELCYETILEGCSFVENDEGVEECSHCGAVKLFYSPLNCTHICHSDNPFVRFWWSIFRFFNKVLEIKLRCPCGVRHY